MRIMVRATFVAAALGDRLRSFHHQCSALRTHFASWFGFNCVLTIGIIRARIEKSEAAAALDHFSSCSAFFLTYGTRDARFCTRLFGGIFFDKFALGVIGARDKSSEAPLALYQSPGLFHLYLW